MLSLGLCIAAFLFAFLCGRKSTVAGILAVLSIGFFYGIARANIISPFSHFLFDFALVGFYCTLPWGTYFALSHLATLRAWTLALFSWPLLVFLLPMQPFLIQLVGLRGHIFFLPVLLVGATLSAVDLRTICVGLAGLNLVAVAFAVAEYIWGVPRFFPLSPVTLIIYSSGDVAGGFLRIPATFANAHAFAANMVAGLPFLIGAIAGGVSSRLAKWLCLMGLIAAVSGVLMASTRMYLVLCAAVLVLAAFKSGSWRSRLWVFVAMAGAAYAAATNPRFQRFKSLDVDSVTERVAGSVNRTFLEVVFDYPMGNGLGGAGTSLPHFLASAVRNPIAIENEYARIALEQGIPGLLLWTSFICWFTFNTYPRGQGSWQGARTLAWWLILWGFVSASIGTGLLTAIPGTFVFLLTVGWLCAAPPVVRRSV